VRVVFLGTGSPRELDRASAAIAVQLVDTPPDPQVDEAACETILLDTGGGNEVLRQLRAAHIAANTIHHIVVTHQHFDHAAGLAILLLELARWPGGPISVYVPAAGLEAIRTVIEVQCPGVITTRLGDRLRFVPLEPGQTVPLTFAPHTEPPAPAHAHAMEPAPEAGTLMAVVARHPVPAMGCVLSWGGRRLGYSGDTAPLPELAAAYAGVDLLIHEASGRDGDGAETFHRMGHSTASDAGRVAAAAGVKRLALTHFPPRTADELRAIMAEAQAEFPGPVVVAADLVVLTVAAAALPPG
jgi:ribonuclease Z